MNERGGIALRIDSRVGGLGDVWMRFLALHALLSLRSASVTLMVPKPLVSIGARLFGDRIRVVADGPVDFAFTHLGLRHTLGPIVRGRRFVFPFYWLMREHRKQTTWKHRLNEAIIRVIAGTGRILLPPRESLRTYQGFMELQALPRFRDVTWLEFQATARREWPALQAKLHEFAGNTRELVGAQIAFPSGSAHQVMPPEWAKVQLPEAVFCFHAADNFRSEYAALGLRTATFSTVEEMLALGTGARALFCTDSFPSHVWQLWGSNVRLLMSQQTAPQVVHPAFPSSQIVDSVAPCCPCRNLARGRHSLCDAGHEVCVTWNREPYITAFKKAVT